MKERLGLLGLPWERIAAVEGATLAPQALIHDNRRTSLRCLSAGEMGCLHSHVIAWQRIAHGHATAALVLEDDILLAPEMPLFLQRTSWLANDNCIVRLETFRMPVVLGKQVASVYGRGLYPLRSIHYGSGAYIITRDRARALLAAYRRYVDTADGMLFRHPRENHVYQLSPAPCIQQAVYQRDWYTTCCDDGSDMEKQRQMALRRSWSDPPAIARRLKWKLASVTAIGCDIVAGYSLHRIPYA
jgi:glycosyl transferase family 25